MYAAVPRIMPIPVIIAGVIVVGDAVTLADVGNAGSSALARPKSSTFHRAIGPQTDVCRLQIPMDDPLLVRRFERLGDLSRDRQRLVAWNRTLPDAIGERGPFHQFEDERLHVFRILERVNGRDVRMIERREHLRFAREPRETVRIEKKGVGQDLQSNVAIQLRIAGAVDLSHATFADQRGDFVDAETGASRQGHEVNAILMPQSSEPLLQLFNRPAPRG